MEPDEETEDAMEVLIQAHKKEKKELQSKIQSLKKTATKGDKKRKKEVQEEISKLESELSKKHAEEIEKLKKELDKEKENELVEEVKKVEESNEKPTMRVTKAQKRRDKKALEQKEREKRILEQELENETGMRAIESQKIKEELKKRGLMTYDIEADGNCLYNAIDHQLKTKANVSLGVKHLRLETGNHIRQNKNDYLPFLTNPNTGEIMSDEEFNQYCYKIENTTNWGGQIELRALSHVVKKPITVIQSDGPPLVMGEEYLDNNNDSLIVTYHRHIYRLGEHYNSVQPYSEET